MNIGALINKKRTEKHMSVRKLSGISDVSKSTISRIENNKVEPGFYTIMKLFKALHIEKDLIFNKFEKIKTSEISEENEK